MARKRCAALGSRSVRCYATRCKRSTPVSNRRSTRLAGVPWRWRLGTSGGRAEAGPDGGGQQVDVGVRQHPVIAQRAAEQVGGHDRHALGVQAAALDVGAVDAQQRGDPVLSSRPITCASQRIVSSVRSSG